MNCCMVNEDNENSSDHIGLRDHQDPRDHGCASSLGGGLKLAKIFISYLATKDFHGALNGLHLAIIMWVGLST